MTSAFVAALRAPNSLTRALARAALIGIGAGLVLSTCTRVRTGTSRPSTVQKSSPEPQSTTWAPLSNRFTYIAFLTKDAADSPAD